MVLRTAIKNLRAILVHDPTFSNLVMLKQRTLGLHARITVRHAVMQEARNHQCFRSTARTTANCCVACRAGSATFGGLLVAGLAASSERGGAAVSARAARVLAHLLLDNPQFKQRVLAIPLEASPAVAAEPRLLMPRCLANLSQALLSAGAIGA